MENTISAVVFFFLFMFAVLHTAGTVFESEHTLHQARLEQEHILDLQRNSELTPLRVTFSPDGTTLTAVYRNSGQLRFYDFSEWDLIVEYSDDADPANKYIEWLSYVDGIPVTNEWGIEDFYKDYEMSITEIYEPNVLNPGEEIALQMRLIPPPAQGKSVNIQLSTSSGNQAVVQSTRNTPPELVVLNPVSVTSRTRIDIDTSYLQVIDAESPPVGLVYTVVTDPLQGNLNLGRTFTQADIDKGLLTYSHTGNGDDSFEFVVSDHADEIGAYSMALHATNAAPTLVANATITVTTSSTITITNHVLRTDDVDNSPPELIYTLVAHPTQGVLSLGPSFTQADIDSGYLTYTHTGTTHDNFSVVITDGTDTIGPFVFNMIKS